MSEVFKPEAIAAALAMPSQGSSHLESNGLDWQDCGAPGFRVKPLLQDTGAGLRTWLMRVEAGAFSELHAHEEVEQIFVLEGSFYDQETTYGPGDFVVRAAGAMHTAGSEDGAVVLLVYSPATGS